MVDLQPLFREGMYRIMNEIERIGIILRWLG